MVSLWLLWLVTEGLCHCCPVKICAGPYFLFPMYSAVEVSSKDTLPGVFHNFVDCVCSPNASGDPLLQHLKEASCNTAQRPQDCPSGTRHLDLGRATSSVLSLSSWWAILSFSDPSVWKLNSFITLFVHLSGGPGNWGMLDEVLATGLTVLNTTNVSWKCVLHASVQLNDVLACYIVVFNYLSGCYLSISFLSNSGAIGNINGWFFEGCCIQVILT